MVYAPVAICLIALVAGNLYILTDFVTARTDVFRTIYRAYFLSTIVVPLLLCAAGITSILMAGVGPRRRILTRAPILAFSIAALLFGARVYATHIEPNRLVVKHVELQTPKVQRRVRIVHITDTQAAFVGNHEARTFEVMQGLKPDLVLFTGDHLQPLPPASIESELPRLTALWKTINPPLGKYGVGGDVDGPIADPMKQGIGGLTTLASSEAVIDADGTSISICGLTLQQSREGQWATPVLEKWLENSPDSSFRIVLGHAPDYMLHATKLSVDLCLAGHTHGGQIRVPFYGPIMTMSSVPRNWARGFRKVGNCAMNVSAGTGAEHAAGLPSIRVNCPPEMTVIDLVP